MTPEQSAAYVMAMVACVNAEVAGMQACNQRDAIDRRPPSFAREDFEALISQYGIHHNAVLQTFQDANR